jgi:hypothetical protein
VRFVAGCCARPPAGPQLGCFGLHEWAMVYRADDVRHPVPLRLGPSAPTAVVESMPLRCSHFDAFRFSAAPPPRPGGPTRAQPDTEQPGCLHANMDLYKWCYKLGPLVDSDCWSPAWSWPPPPASDMRASPYDLRGSV